MKIIDFEKKGNVVRFYLGEDKGSKWHGDDWDDYPYEHNAGLVYYEYISGAIDVAFPYDCEVLEPCDGSDDSGYCKNDMVARVVPCLIIIPPELSGGWYGFRNFKKWVGADDIIKIYLGDDESVLDQFEWKEHIHDVNI